MFGRAAGLGDALDDFAAVGTSALVMIVVRKLRGGGGSRCASLVSALGRSSGPNLAVRFTSNSTSSLPFAGQVVVERRHDRARADREVDHRLEGEDRRQVREPATRGYARDLLLQRLRQRDTTGARR